MNGGEKEGEGGMNERGKEVERKRRRDEGDQEKRWGKEGWLSSNNTAPLL